MVSNIDYSNLLPYCIFPNSFIRNNKLPAQQKILFEIFCSYDHIGSDGTRKGWCSPSLDTVSNQIGLTKRAVQVHLKRLVECGMISIVYRNNEMVKDSPRSSIYVLNILPGLSETDRKRIAAARTTEIRHLISGLHTIKIQTTTGMHYIDAEEFDLEMIITGSRASNIMDGEVGSADDVISKMDEDLTTSKEMNKFTGEQLSKEEAKAPDNEKISFKPNRNPPKEKPIGFDSADVIERIKSGNYKSITSRNICLYFKHLFEVTYPREIYAVDYIKEIGIINARATTYSFDVLIPMIEFFIQRYDKLFSNTEYPRPRIYQLSIPWILNKVQEQFTRAEQSKEEMQESIHVQSSNQEVRMF